MLRHAAGPHCAACRHALKFECPSGMQSIGEDDDAVEASSAGLQETEEGFQPVFFDPRPLRNLVLVDEMESLSPVTDLKARYCCGAEAAHQDVCTLSV